eukprot:CAMPEP_0178909070 /NCGR_PEP_ID=MMETSP0786-20121207/8284_1 /TAXON_ID=186022 /ORGANISM="Thalassionema frauenfeldii, Strain CCMP 1798" /LENGTH=293 /DNA_ID=CAMNT_0020581063 /DNA_START=97 /DNA_END=978 /DNA_ORIENTATION=-
MSDGPFGEAPEIGIGFTDTALLVVSFGGFIMLGSLVYSIIMLRLQSREEFEKKQEEELDYDEQLAHADVTTLNRAQRRARAKHIMKQERRIAMPETANRAVLEDDLDNNQQQRRSNLTRKERQKVAKEKERMERKLFEEDRRRQQSQALEVAREKKKHRKELEAIKREEQRKCKMLQQEELERGKIQRWKTFLKSENEEMTVEHFVLYAKERKTLDLMKISEKFHFPFDKVHARVKELISSRQITGIFIDQRHFLYINQDEMQQAVSLMLQEKEQKSFESLAEELNEIITFNC